MFSRCLHLSLPPSLPHGAAKRTQSLPCFKLFECFLLLYQMLLSLCLDSCLRLQLLFQLISLSLINYVPATLAAFWILKVLLTFSSVQNLSPSRLWTNESEFTL